VQSWTVTLPACNCFSQTAFLFTLKEFHFPHWMKRSELLLGTQSMSSKSGPGIQPKPTFSDFDVPLHPSSSGCFHHSLFIAFCLYSWRSCFPKPLQKHLFMFKPEFSHPLIPWAFAQFISPKVASYLCDLPDHRGKLRVKTSQFIDDLIPCSLGLVEIQPKRK
jgi:hypothetical protein